MNLPLINRLLQLFFNTRLYALVHHLWKKYISRFMKLYTLWLPDQTALISYWGILMMFHHSTSFPFIIKTNCLYLTERMKCGQQKPLDKNNRVAAYLDNAHDFEKSGFQKSDKSDENIPENRKQRKCLKMRKPHYHPLCSVFPLFVQPSDMQNIFYLTILKIIINPSNYIPI